MVTPDHVREFSGAYRFLSNFFIEPDGTCVESAYQGHKTWPPNLDVMHMPPKQAKAVGRRLPLRADWEQIKRDVMYRLVLSKFMEHDALRRQLLATGGAYLEEGNWWGDRYWGTVDGVGQNHLGRILMRVRSEV